MKNVKVVLKMNRRDDRSEFMQIIFWQKKNDKILWGWHQCTVHFGDPIF